MRRDPLPQSGEPEDVNRTNVSPGAVRRRIVDLDTRDAESVRWWVLSTAAGTYRVRCAPVEAEELAVTLATGVLVAGTTASGTVTGPAGTVWIEYDAAGAATQRVTAALAKRVINAPA